MSIEITGESVADILAQLSQVAAPAPQPPPASPPPPPSPPVSPSPPPSPPASPPPPPSPPPPASQVGPTISSNLTLPAGHFSGTARIEAAVTVQGAGLGQTVIDATGLVPAGQKAVLWPTVSGCVLSDLSLTGAAISAIDGANAAGVRLDATTDIVMNNVECFGNQNGILGAGTITLNGCHFHDNGGAQGLTHELYINGGPLFTLNNVIATCGSKSTHALKSRSAHTIVNGGVYTGSADSVGLVGGSVMDFPDGGVVEANGATIVVSAGASNTIAIGYAMEAGNNGLPGMTLTNVVIDNHNNNPAVITTNKSGVTLNLTGCTYKGIAPSITGFAVVNGSFTPAP